MFSCQFSKLVKKHIIISHKSGMFDDGGAICLCKSVRGSLYHLFQWVIPISFFPLIGCGVFPDDVGQRDTGHSITLAEEFVNYIKSLCVGSSKVPFLMCTLEIPQKNTAQVHALNLLLSLLLSFSLNLSLSLNYELISYFCFCFFSHLCGSFNRSNSTSLSFSEFSELFASILLLSQHIESHFALSSARCHF